MGSGNRVTLSSFGCGQPQRYERAGTRGDRRHMFDWITGLVQQGGYLGIAALMLAENLFPPIPSELIMPLAGFSAARGEMNLWLVILAGTVGSLLGAVFWFYVGKALGRARMTRWAASYGRWLTVSPAEIDRACEWFQRHGGKAVFLGRLVPAVRTLISVPAGIAAMPLPAMLFWSGLGTAIWSTFLTVTGYLLEGQYKALEGYLNPLSNVVVGLIVVIYVYRVVTFRADRG